MLPHPTGTALFPYTTLFRSSPAHGTLSLNSDGSFSYTPALNYNGPDSFTYKANDGLADSPTNATVSITVKTGRAHVCTPVTQGARMPSTAPKKTTLTVVAPG